MHRNSTFLSAGAVLLVLALAGCPDRSTRSETAADPSGNGHNQMVSDVSRYSKSGYDLTPLTSEELETIVADLTPEQVRITQHAGTEPPFCSAMNNNKEPGTYVSVVGGLPLFRSGSKFDSGSGWPSFFEPFDPDHIIEHEDRSAGMVRTEILDARSGAHLGHVFDDGPPPTGKRYCVNAAALTFIPEGEPLPPESRPVKAEVAYFAGGCFWGIEDRFAKHPGVMDAVSGYQGGETANPTYEQVCGGKTGHAETVQVTFDPNRTTYRDLLEEFFRMHDPTTRNRQGPDVGSQYRSAIFASTEEQEKAARAYVDELSDAGKFRGREIVTIIEPAGPFFAAEEYHQDYHAKHGGSCSY